MGIKKGFTTVSDRREWKKIVLEDWYITSRSIRPQAGEQEEKKKKKKTTRKRRKI